MLTTREAQEFFGLAQDIGQLLHAAGSNPTETVWADTKRKIKVKLDAANYTPAQFDQAMAALKRKHGLRQRTTKLARLQFEGGSDANAR